MRKIVGLQFQLQILSLVNLKLLIKYSLEFHISMEYVSCLIFYHQLLKIFFFTSTYKHVRFSICDTAKDLSQAKSSPISLSTNESSLIELSRSNKIKRNKHAILNSSHHSFNSNSLNPILSNNTMLTETKYGKKTVIVHSTFCFLFVVRHYFYQTFRNVCTCCQNS